MHISDWYCHKNFMIMFHSWIKAISRINWTSKVVNWVRGWWYGFTSRFVVVHFKTFSWINSSSFQDCLPCVKKGCCLRIVNNYCIWWNICSLYMIIHLGVGASYGNKRSFLSRPFGFNLHWLEFGSLTTAQLMEKVRGLQNLAYQLGLEEGTCATCNF